MIERAIGFILGNLPAILFVGAFVMTAVTKSPAYFPARLLNWLLLSIGIAYAWAGFFHMVFPHVAASSIGWQVSPFQFEIGVADASIGIVTILSFWRSLDFKAPLVGYLTLFSIGVSFGHFREAIYAGNTAANNFGLLLAITLAHIVLLPTLYVLTRKKAV